ncbi:MAG: DNA primase catalytic subunit PriS [Candidatus Micrarchaeota archaeon]
MNYLLHFRSYYQRNSINVDLIHQREFGIGIDKKINYRHKAFSNQREFQNFLVSDTPRFISHSVGKFEFPWSQPMEKKNLLGADLVFDLDAKPEEGDAHNAIFCQHCVETARSDTIRLIENYLLPIFGLSEKDLLIAFSGSKGFHVHVKCKAVQQLSSTSRRLLVDYITGKELTVDSLVQRVKQRGSSGALVNYLQGPGKNSTGWQKHFRDAAISLLSNPAGVFQKRKAQYLQENLQNVINLINNGNWAFFLGSDEVTEQLLQKVVREYGVQVDSPVTFDVHRLIRVPGTLHGDTGFIARPLSRSELGKFEATKNAVAFSSRAYVELKQPASVTFAGEDFSLPIGRQDVPLSLAVLLACRGMV